MKTQSLFTLRPKAVFVLLILFALLIAAKAPAQSCTPTGNQATYGTDSVWRAYVYQGKAFDKYRGYVTEGTTAAGSNFDESFGGSQATYNTNSCSAYTDTFSVRYRLTERLAAGTYTFTVGGDDGYRFSLDGGSTWAINNWADHSYTTTAYSVTLTAGSYNLVLEYYENFGDNRVSFNQVKLCAATGSQTVYGTSNTWIGYMYQGMNFDTYKGTVTEGNSTAPTFDENFGNPGGVSVPYSTNQCSITTQQFSARYRLTRSFTPATYVITIGGDDGFRFSLDGGSTWVINKWQGQSYTVASYTFTVSTTTSYNMVLEYYQDGGYNRVSYSMSSSVLPVTLTDWSGQLVNGNQSQLSWSYNNAIDFDHFILQRSTDGHAFPDIATVPASAVNTASGNGLNSYTYTDRLPSSGNYYYRLAMVDRNGSTSYSTVLLLSSQNTGNVRMYPTLVENGSLYVESGQPVREARWELFDMNGHKLMEKTWSLLHARQQVFLTASGQSSLIKGAYIARLSGSGGVQARQIIIVK